MVSPQPKLPSSCPKLPSSSNEATVVHYFGQTCLPSSRGDSFGEYCIKTRKGSSLSFWCKVYHAAVFFCSKFERDQWSQRGASRQKLLEASGRVGAILTTLASRGGPQWSWSDFDCNWLTWRLQMTWWLNKKPFISNHNAQQLGSQPYFFVWTCTQKYTHAHIQVNMCVVQCIESTKTTSVEDVSTGVLEKKEYLRSNDKAKKWYDVSRHI